MECEGLGVSKRTREEDKSLVANRAITDVSARTDIGGT